MRGGAVRPAPMTPTWHAEHTPAFPAIEMGASGETVTYAQLEERSARFARALRSRGLAAGDHIAIFMENNRPYLEVAWAAQRSGLYYTAVNTHLRPGEVQYVLDDCGAVAVIASQALAEVVAAPLVFSMSMHRLGATAVVMERFDPRACLELIERHRVTHAQLVPTMFIRMLRLPEEQRTRYDLSSLRYVTHAAAPCPIAVKRQMLDWWGPIIHEYYSRTEDIGTAAITPQERLGTPCAGGGRTGEGHISR